jgi:hypothetical protein
LWTPARFTTRQRHPQSTPGPSYYLAAPKNHTPALEEMEVLSSIFGVENFLHPVLPVLHLFWSVLKGARPFVGTIFKLRNRRRAILSEQDHRTTVIPIPAKATVVLLGGDIDEDPFVEIRYGGRVLLMRSEDLRNSGELLGKLP